MSGIVAQNAGRHTGLVKAAAGGGSWNLILTQTASSSATIDFTSGIDDTYKEYVFRFINIHAETDDADFSFQASTDTGSSYGVTVTTTNFQASHSEADSGTGVNYEEAYDIAQGTGFQVLMHSIGADNDQAASGSMYLFNPSNTTFDKHFSFEGSNYHSANYETHHFVEGYFNTTSAIDAIQFKMSADAIDSGTISMYGIS